MPSPDRLVINTSPLLAIIAGCGSLAPIEGMYRDVPVSKEVVEEIEAGGAHGFGAAELAAAGWLGDFGGNFFGISLLGLTSYMFDSRLPQFTRGFSLFHGWLPLLLMWLLFRLGYDKRAMARRLLPHAILALRRSFAARSLDQKQ